MNITIEKILKYIILTCSILILCLPLLVTKSTMFSFVFGKIIFFQIFVTISAICWILLALKNSTYRPYWKHPLVFMPLAFLVVLLGTALFGVNFSNSLWSSQERMIGLITLFHFYIWFLILTTVYTTWEKWRSLFLVSCCVSIAVFFLGISNGMTIQMQSTIGNQLFLGNYAIVHIYLALIFFFLEKKKLFKFFTLITVVISILIIFLTGERTPLITLFIGIILIPSLAFIIKSSLKVKIISGLTYILLILVCGGFFWFTTSQGMPVGKKVLPYIVQKTFYHFSLGLNDRIDIWLIGLKGFQERPIFGWGWENFNILFNKYVDPALNEIYLREPWYDRSHNQLIDILALSGIFGFIVYIILWLCIFYFLIKLFFQEQEINKRFAIGFLILLFFSYFVQHLSNFDTPVTLILFYLMIAFLFFLTQESIQKNGNKNGMQSKYILISAPFIGIVMVSILYQTSIQPFFKSRLAVQAQTIFKTGKLDEALVLYKHAVEGNCFTNREIRQEVARALISAIQQKVMTDNQLKAWVEFITQEIEKNINEYPQDVRQYLIGSAVYRAAHPFNADAIDRALELTEKAYGMSPSRLDVYYEYSQVETLRKNVGRAQFWAQKALDVLKPKEQQTFPLLNKVAVDIGLKKWEDAINSIDEANKYGAFILEKEPKYLLLFASQIPKPFDKELVEKLIPVYDQALLRYKSANMIASKILLYYKAGEQEKLQKSLDELKQFNIEAHKQVMELLEKEKQKEIVIPEE